jgi:hypothetical protein
VASFHFARKARYTNHPRSNIVSIRLLVERLRANRAAAPKLAHAVSPAPAQERGRASAKIPKKVRKETRAERGDAAAQIEDSEPGAAGVIRRRVRDERGEHALGEAKARSEVGNARRWPIRGRAKISRIAAADPLLVVTDEDLRTPVATARLHEIFPPADVNFGEFESRVWHHHGSTSRFEDFDRVSNGSPIHFCPST